MLRHLVPRLHEYERLVLNPSQAASLVASGCDCDAGPQNAASFALGAPPTQTVAWSGIIGFENQMTGDGRLIEPNALRWENLPIPIRYAPVDTGGHQGAEVVGWILAIQRGPLGQILSSGTFDMGSEIGCEAARVVGEQICNGISMDLDDVSFEIRISADVLGEVNDPILEPVEPGTDSEGRVTVISMKSDDEVMVTLDARVRAATLVAIPAFADAKIYLDQTASAPAPVVPLYTVKEPEQLVASGYPLEPPAAWFVDPQLDGPTPLTVTKDGRVFGHLAVWGTCHTAYTGQCVEPPHSASGYAFFRTGAVLTAEGREVATGRVTFDTMHAGRNMGPADTMAHYEHTGKAASDVAAGEDAWGIWIAGAVRPGLSAEKVRDFRASPLSGDWRRIGGSLELVAALAVNSPGFPIPRAKGLVASGAMQSLVASGMLAPTEINEEVLSPEDIAYLKSLAVRGLQEIQTEAEALAARARNAEAAQLARRMMAATR